jgi:Ni,Fe-hydrogenase maturation factor
MSRVFLVGIGNTLRRDDGAGHAVVSAFADHPRCRISLVHQLVPELVDEFVHYDRVGFVDAAVGLDEIGLEEVTEVARPATFGHVGDARWLVGLCRLLHGISPRAFLLSVPVRDLDHGEGFGVIATRNIALAIQRLEIWLEAGS